MRHLSLTCRAAATLAAAFGLAAPALSTAAHDAMNPHPAYLDSTARPALPINSAVHSGGGTAEDTALANAVADELAREARLKGTTITVSANKGSVMLSGSAQSIEQAAYAEQCAQRVAGVTRVAGTLSNMAG